ncbi:MAG TPA: BamA/TamA family outer membrane protein [Longimicrobiales bacterium]
MRSLPKDLVESALETQETHCKSFVLELFCGLDAGWAQRKAYLDSAAVQRDTGAIRRVYADWGYPAAHATAEIRSEGAREAVVVFRVSEGQPMRVRSIAVRGLEGTGVSAPPLPLKPGQPYAPALLDAAQRLILARLGSSGRPFAQVEVTGNVEPGTSLADVVLNVTPGPMGVFGRTTIDARRPLSQSLVEQRIAWRAGARFDPRALARTQERLQRIPVVDTARVAPSAGGRGDSAVDVVVTVVPGRIAGLTGGGSLSSASCLTGDAYWTDRYFGGKPRVLTIGAGAANLLATSLNGFPCTGAGTGAFADPDYFVSGDWREPMGADTWLLLSANYSRQSAPGAYIYRGAGGRLALDRDVRPGLDAILSVAPSRTQSTAGAPFYCALFGVCSGARLGQLQDFTTLVPLGLDVIWAPPGHQTRLFGPASGPTAGLAVAPPRWLYTARLSGAAAPVTAMHYARGEVSGSLTRLLGRRLELAARLRLGGLTSFGDTLPPQLRLFGGGPNGVRGAQQNLLGPKFLVADSAQAAALICGNTPGGCTGVTITPNQVQVRSTGGNFLVESSLEGRIWVSERVQLAAFADYGYVRSGALAGAPGALSSEEAMLSPGVGIRFATPAGPLRLDVGYDPTRTIHYPLLAQRPDGTFLNLGEATYDPYRQGSGSGFTRFRRHLQLQFSLGQPF